VESKQEVLFKQLVSAYFGMVAGERCSVTFWPMTQNLTDGVVRDQLRQVAPEQNSRAGLVYGLSAYVMWGFIPLYFRAVSDVSPFIVLCHRIIWSALFMTVVVSIRAEWKSIWPALRSRRNVLLLGAGALLIALNWLVFIYAVATRQLLQASLGYFINPLLSIALGMIFLRERLRGWQWLAVIAAAAAVVNLALRGAGFPWLAVSLACSFGFYGLVRKAVDINSLHGLTIESAFLFPIAAVMLLAWHPKPIPLPTLGILSLSGVVTAVPLLCFGAAVRRLQLSTMGFLQYVGPTLQFLVAVCLFREPLNRARLGSFALCWLAIAVYVADSVLNRRVQPIADEPE
jgi:chloramphenicol-sensitive protein RarD